MIRAVLFDYGGTLVHMERPWREVKVEAIRSEYKALQRSGLSLAYEDYHKLNDSTFIRYTEMEAAEDRDIPDITKYRELIDGLFPTRPETWRAKVAATANRTFWATVTENLTLRDDVRSSLESLRSMGVRMSVVSNHHNAESLSAHLKSLQISKYFSHVLASSQMQFRKPDPRILRKSLSLLKTGRNEAVFVGDSREFDVAGAKRAGMRSILIVPGESDDGSPNPTGPEPDFIVHSLTEVPKIVSSL